MRNVDEMAIKAAKDETLFSEFVEEQKHFIGNCVFKSTGKYITNSDDEWSVALIAFSDAVKTYNFDKGLFLLYAETIIKHRLIDYHRGENKHNAECSVNPRMFDDGESNDDDELNVKIEVTEKLVDKQENSIKYEIEAANAELKKFGFSFFDLADCSPKSAKTKDACRKAVLYVLQNPIIKEEIYQSRQLPIKIIQKILTYPEN